MSSAARAAARRLHERRVRADPADPQAGPERLAHRADRDHGLAVGIERGDRRRRLARRRGAGPTIVSSITSGVRVARASATSRSRSAARHRQPGRVLVVGDHVREPRRGLAQRRREHVQVPAAGQHRHRHRAGRRRRGRRRAPPGRSGARRARGRRGPASTRSSSVNACRAPAVTSTCSGAVGAPRARQVRGDRRAQHRQPGGVVARARADAAGARRWRPRARRAARPRAPRWPRS